MNGCLLCRRGWKFFFVEIAKKAFSIVFFLGVSNASDPVKPSSKRRKHRARTSRSNNNNSTSNNNSVENSIMFLEKFTGQCKCGNVRFSGRKLFYSFACHCDACRNAYEKQGKGFATPILGLKMFTTVNCEKENSIERFIYQNKDLILTDKIGYPQFYTQLLFKIDDPTIKIKTVINNEEGITEMSNCKKIERFKEES